MAKQMTSEPTGSMKTKYLWFAYILVALFSVLPYLNVLHGEFVVDDVVFYVDNPALTADPNIGRFFISNVWDHSTVEIKNSPLYRPFFLTVMWVNQTLFGGNVVAYHLFNIALHLTATLLLLTLLRRLLPASGLLPALAGALIFAVHPIHVEAVTWIGAFGHSMATALLLGAMLGYLRYTEGRGSRYWFALSLTLFALALFSMETAMAFPLLITAYEYLRLRRVNFGRVIPFWVVLALYFVVRKLVLGQLAPLNLDHALAWGTALNFAIGYLEFLFVPWPQFMYLEMPAQGVATPTGGILAFMLVAIAVVAVRLKTKEKTVLMFGLSWILLALTPLVLSSLNPFPLFALRALYLPSVGVSILVAWAVAVSLHRQKTTVAAIVFLLAAAVPATMLANRDWLVNSKVYEKIYSVTQSVGSAIALADIYGKDGEAAAAERVLLQATELAQDDPSRVNVYERLGLLYGTGGAVTQSEQYYRKVLELSPRHSSAWVGLGNNAWARGDIKSALDFYLAAVEADPENYEAKQNVALAYRQLGDLPPAAEYSERASRLQQPTSKD